MIKHRRLAILFLGVLFPALASAQVKINGFASAGIGVFNGDYEEGDPVEGFYTDNFDAAPFTKFALQVKATVNSNTSVIGQFLATGPAATGPDDYDTRAEWAYISYDVTADTTLRFGRMRAPLFMYSDYIDVGYAYPWIRAPIEIYRLPFSSLEGVDLVKLHSFGDWSGTFQSFYGNLSEDSVINEEPVFVNLTDFMGANYVLTNDWVSFRLSYTRTEFDFSTPEPALELLGGLALAAADPALSAFSSDISELIDILVMENETGAFYGAGLTIDWRDWLVASEYTEIAVEEQSLVSDDYAWYFMLGKRLGDFTFHVTYQEQEGDPDYGVLDRIPNIGSPFLELLRTNARAAIVNEVDTALLVGFRYDYGASTAFKFEVGDLEQVTDGIEGTTVSFSLDIVF